MRSSAAALLLVACLIGCDHSEPAKQHQPALPIAQPWRGDFDPARAVALWYGNYDAGTQTARWHDVRTSWPDADVDFLRSAPIVRILYHHPVNGRKTAQHFLVTTAFVDRAGWDCHACSPVLGIALFRRNDDGRWSVEAESKHVTKVGAWGQTSGTLSALELSPDRYAIRIDDAGDGGGQHTTWTEIAMPIGNSVRRVFRVVTSDDNSGACGPGGLRCYRFQSWVSLIPQHEGFSEIAVKSHGTRFEWLADSEKICTANQVRRFRFDGAEYREVIGGKLRPIEYEPHC